ncbi:uncharacterized protein TNCV_3640341 [Trichonephila clavipes]|nr:uncharacterized protein TNCV_3640341 [Trichonephila clavipes]
MRHNKCRYKKVFGLNRRPIMISKAVAELGQRFSVMQYFMNPPSPYSSAHRSAASSMGSGLSMSRLSICPASAVIRSHDSSQDDTTERRECHHHYNHNPLLPHYHLGSARSSAAITKDFMAANAGCIYHLGRFSVLVLPSRLPSTAPLHCQGASAISTAEIFKHGNKTLPVQPYNRFSVLNHLVLVDPGYEITGIMPVDMFSEQSRDVQQPVPPQPRIRITDVNEQTYSYASEASLAARNDHRGIVMSPQHTEAYPLNCLQPSSPTHWKPPETRSKPTSPNEDPAVIKPLIAPQRSQDQNREATVPTTVSTVQALPPPIQQLRCIIVCSNGLSKPTGPEDYLVQNSPDANDSLSLIDSSPTQPMTGRLATS